LWLDATSDFPRHKRDMPVSKADAMAARKSMERVRAILRATLERCRAGVSGHQWLCTSRGLPDGTARTASQISLIPLAGKIWRNARIVNFISRLALCRHQSYIVKQTRTPVPLKNASMI
jgi:hypothetical protein